MGKYKTKEDTQETAAEPAAPQAALAIFSGNMLANPCATMVEEGGDFLPNFKIPFGIEDLKLPVLDGKGMPMMRNGKPVMESATGKFVLSAGGKVTGIPTPYILTAYCIRGATRQTIEKDGKKTYIRTLSNMRVDESGKPFPSSEKHAAQVGVGQKGGVDVGNINLVVCMYKDHEGDKAVVGLLESFKTMTKYFTDPLMHGLLRDGRGILVTVEDHNENTTKSNAGFNYYDARKFTQWQSMELSKEQFELAASALKAKAPAVDAWLKREE
jgi:hypothetical protein